MTRTNTRQSPRSKAPPPVEEQPLIEDDEDGVALGTDIALVVLEAMIGVGVKPIDAAAECWKVVQLFLETRAQWVEAMEAEYGP